MLVAMPSVFCCSARLALASILDSAESLMNAVMPISTGTVTSRIKAVNRTCTRDCPNWRTLVAIDVPSLFSMERIVGRTGADCSVAGCSVDSRPITWATGAGASGKAVAWPSSPRPSSCASRVATRAFSASISLMFMGAGGVSCSENRFLYCSCTSVRISSRSSLGFRTVAMDAPPGPLTRPSGRRRPARELRG